MMYIIYSVYDHYVYKKKYALVVLLVLLAPLRFPENIKKKHDTFFILLYLMTHRSNI